MRALRSGTYRFTDAKRKLASYAASEATLFALRAAGGSYLREDMLALVKTGLCGVNAEQAEILKIMPLRAEYAAARSNPLWRRRTRGGRGSQGHCYGSA